MKRYNSLLSQKRSFSSFADNKKKKEKKSSSVFLYHNEVVKFLDKDKDKKKCLESFPNISIDSILKRQMESFLKRTAKTTGTGRVTTFSWKDLFLFGLVVLFLEVIYHFVGGEEEWGALTKRILSPDYVECAGKEPLAEPVDLELRLGPPGATSNSSPISDPLLEERNQNEGVERNFHNETLCRGFLSTLIQDLRELYKETASSPVSPSDSKWKKAILILTKDKGSSYTKYVYILNDLQKRGAESESFQEILRILESIS